MANPFSVLRPNDIVWRRTILLTAILLAAITLAESKSTHLVMSWKNPNYSGQPFRRILVIGMSQDPVVRLDFEDDLSAEITREGMEAIPGNHILLRPDSPDIDVDYLKGQIRDHKIDAVIVSRLTKFNSETTYHPGHAYSVPYAYYNSFYGYYRAVYYQVQTPGYLRTDTTVSIETALYSATPPNEDLVWIAYSDTFNPKNADKVIADLVKLVVKQLEKEAIISKNP